jgi:Fe2+ or Zn2+ uptake regulation protein
MTKVRRNEESDRIAAALRESGRRATPQRLVVYEALMSLGHHATAEAVLDAASSRLPNISLPTVYAALDVLEELGAIRRIRAGDKGLLFEPRLDAHHHLVCRRCGRVEDLEAEVEVAPVVAAAKRRGFVTEGTEIVVGGVCARCAARLS